jgi:hypothetical protein
VQGAKLIGVKPLAQSELNSRQAVERFRKAAKVFTQRAIKSKESARRVLVEEGIYTTAGKLTKQYR